MTSSPTTELLRRHPSGWVLAAQLVAILAYPFLDDSVAGRAILGVVQIAIVLAALYAVRRTPTLTWVGILLAPPAMLFTVMEAVWPDTGWIVLGSALLHAPFYFYVSYGMIRYLFHDDRVTRDELFATAAAFTVVAWGFAYVYAAVQVLSPGSFTGAGGTEQTWFELLYLSFAQLTSVGLSDVVPIEAHARSVAILEMVAGVFYIALVVARMVGLTIVRQQRR
ncbi:ion channel [Nocardioides euryhalodurans]|uniref:Two pore domain potassium channel family protein n=1 Tax=Nocardioides euryhalodurans TaxID=2518370 RepID=A0A4P7GGN1_9ACTN|nr:ion channel [Nocardioides euryhalodurans]QBR91020.1 two pore domain potassium channel family protein [Nocardioides euryhalodurans]